MKRPISIGRQDLILLAFCLGCLFLLLLRSYLITSLVPRNVEYADLLEEIKAVRAQNVLIREQILHESALSTIEKRAFQQGFIRSSSVYVVR